MKSLITPEEISTLARPCYADEAKALAYIYECEQNDIKKVIGDDLFIQLKEGGQTFLLEGGIYERNGKRYELNGIKRALAYYVYSRLLESSSVELTRQGVVNRRSDHSNDADDREIISVSRETLAIADRYMQEVAVYLGIGEAESSQRTKIMVIGGSNSVTPSSSGGAGGGKSVNVVQGRGNSTEDVMSQYAVTREIESLEKKIEEVERGDIDLSEYATKDYVDERISEIEIGGGGEIPDLENYATKEFVAQEIEKIEIPDTSGLASQQEVADVKSTALEYTDTKIKELTIPTKTSELTNDSGFATEDALGEFVNAIAEYVETKADKTSVITSEDIGNDTLDWDKEYHFTMTKDTSVVIYDKPNDDYAHSIEIEMTTGEETYSFSINLGIKWVKDLEIEPNKRYMIIIDDSMTAMWVAVERSDNE